MSREANGISPAARSLIAMRVARQVRDDLRAGKIGTITNKMLIVLLCKESGFPTDGGPMELLLSETVNRILEDHNRAR